MPLLCRMQVGISGRAPSSASDCDTYGGRLVVGPWIAHRMCLWPRWCAQVVPSLRFTFPLVLIPLAARDLLARLAPQVRLARLRARQARRSTVLKRWSLGMRWSFIASCSLGRRWLLWMLRRWSLMRLRTVSSSSARMSRRSPLRRWSAQRMILCRCSMLNGCSGSMFFYWWHITFLGRLDVGDHHMASVCVNI